MAKRPRHHGLTLVEVILVLALLVVIAAVSTPLLEGSFTRAGLQGGGDLLRAAWGKARLAAMESGETARLSLRAPRQPLSDHDARRVEQSGGAIHWRKSTTSRAIRPTSSACGKPACRTASSSPPATSHPRIRWRQCSAPCRLASGPIQSSSTRRHDLRRLAPLGKRRPANDPRHASWPHRHLRRRAKSAGSSYRPNDANSSPSLRQKPSRRATSCRTAQGLHAAGDHPLAGHPRRRTGRLGRGDAAGRPQRPDGSRRIAGPNPGLVGHGRAAFRRSDGLRPSIRPLSITTPIHPGCTRSRSIKRHMWNWYSPACASSSSCRPNSSQPISSWSAGCRTQTTSPPTPASNRLRLRRHRVRRVHRVDPAPPARADQSTGGLQ